MQENRLIGIEDTEFMRGKVPMTKQEIRILTIVKAKILPTDIVLDVGAGTGSLSIEAARQAYLGKVYAIERNSEGCELIQQNKVKFACDNLEIIAGVAPEAIPELEKLNVVLIGGSGGNLAAIFTKIHPWLVAGGRIIVNAITIETLAATLEYFHSNSEYEYETVAVQVNKLRSVGAYHMLQAENQIYIITAIKKG